MEAASCLARLDANGAGRPLRVLSPTMRAILTLEWGAVASETDRPHGKARGTYAAIGICTGHLATGADHEAVSMPVLPRLASDDACGRWAGLNDSINLECACLFIGMLARENCFQYRGGGASKGCHSLTSV